MSLLSSQDFQNCYERLYKQVRNYLWPYDVLVDLANFEANVYSTFIDMDKLRVDFEKLKKSMKAEIKEDEDLAKMFDKMSKLVYDDEAGYYAKIRQVNEVNPENNKVLKVPDNNKEEEEI